MPSTKQTSGPVQYANVVAIAASGWFAGATLLIGITGVTRWPGMDPLVWQAGFWTEFIGFAAGFVPFFLATLIGILISRKNTTDPTARKWWTIALVMWGVNSAITSFYHLPKNLQLHDLAFTSAEAASVRTMWLSLHVPRLILAFGTSLATILATIHGVKGHAQGSR